MTQTLGEIMREEDESRLVAARREIAAEKAAWDALTDEERAATIAAAEDKWAAYADYPEDEEDEEE